MYYIQNFDIIYSKNLTRISDDIYDFIFSKNGWNVKSDGTEKKNSLVQIVLTFFQTLPHNLSGPF